MYRRETGKLERQPRQRLSLPGRTDVRRAADLVSAGTRGQLRLILVLTQKEKSAD